MSASCESACIPLSPFLMWWSWKTKQSGVQNQDVHRCISVFSCRFMYSLLGENCLAVSLLGASLLQWLRQRLYVQRILSLISSSSSRFSSSSVRNGHLMIQQILAITFMIAKWPFGMKMHVIIVLTGIFAFDLSSISCVYSRLPLATPWCLPVLVLFFCEMDVRDGAILWRALYQWLTRYLTSFLCSFNLRNYNLVCLA